MNGREKTKTHYWWQSPGQDMPNPLTENERMREKISNRRNKIVQGEAAGFQDAEQGVLAEENYRANYGDVVSDPVLDKIGRHMDHVLVHQGDRRPHAERYQAIGSTLRSFVDNPTALGALKSAGSMDEAVNAALRVMQMRPADVDAESRKDASQWIESEIESRRGPINNL